MTHEIGSEFWDMPIAGNKNTLFVESAQWFLSGRSALTAIIRIIKKNNKDIHTVAMPSWCCASMVVPFLREGIKVHYYPVYYEDRLE